MPPIDPPESPALSAEALAVMVAPILRDLTETIANLVDRLQACAATEEAHQKAMRDFDATQPYRRVGAFHTMIGAPIHCNPVVPPDDRVRLRLRLILEEVFELIEGCFNGFPYLPHDQLSAGRELADIRARLFRFVDCAPRFDVDLPAVADALADIDYVVEGTRLEFGIFGPPIAAAVHHANMAKAGGTVDANGKMQKPPGWTPPDIAGELRRQGWAPIVHCLRGGRALCGRPGLPADWPGGESWVPVPGMRNVTCPGCRGALAQILEWVDP